jgi:hypothetical protein
VLISARPGARPRLYLVYSHLGARLRQRSR